MTSNNLSKEELLDYLTADNIQVDEELLSKAKNNDTVSLVDIGDFYYSELNYTRALGWYHLAANQDDAYSQNRVGFMYQQGQGVDIDYMAAMQWYMKAQRKEFHAASNNIGSLYENGLGVRKNSRKALKWFRKAAENGNPSGQYNTGRFYEKGWSCRKNIWTALEYYERSAIQGYQLGIIAKLNLNVAGFYLSDKQMEHIIMEKDLRDEIVINIALEATVKSLIKELQEAKDIDKKKDNFINTLMQEIQALKADKKEKLESSMDEKDAS